MEVIMSELVNLNTASVDELTTLPGVGSTIAERILAARPFEVLEDLQQVEGIGPAFVERIASLVTLELDVPALEAEPVPDTEAETDSLEAAEADEASPGDGLSPEEDADLDDSDDEIVQEKESPKVKTVTRWQALAMSIVSSFIAFVLALVLTLGILGGINGGLRFVRPAQLFEMGRQIEVLDEQISILTQDIEGLRDRLSNLEGVGERVDHLDEAIAGVVEQTEFLVDEMNDLRSDAVEFQYFLDGLRELLNAILPPENP